MNDNNDNLLKMLSKVVLTGNLSVKHDEPKTDNKEKNDDNNR
jgi:hypothetical protein